MDGSTPAAPASAVLPVQSRVFEVVASNDVLVGAIHDLAPQFGLTPHDFRHCLDGLVHTGWVTVKTEREILLSIQLEG